jgi:hypothetical protein
LSENLGSLSLLEPSEPIQARTGIATIIIIIIIIMHNGKYGGSQHTV